MNNIFKNGVKFLIFLIGVLPLIFSCYNTHTKKTEIDFSENEITFSLFSVSSPINNFFRINEISKDIFSIKTINDSVPICLNIDSIALAQVINDTYILLVNPSIYEHNGFILIGNKSKVISYQLMGNIQNASYFYLSNMLILRLTVSERIFAFDNPPVEKEYFLLIDLELNKECKALSILKSGKVLHDSLHFELSTKIGSAKEELFVYFQGNNNTENIIDSIKIFPEITIPENLKDFNWNNNIVVKIQTFKPN